MSKIDDILSSSDASDALLGEQIDKLDEKTKEIDLHHVSGIGIIAKGDTQYQLPKLGRPALVVFERHDKVAPSLYLVDRSNAVEIKNAIAGLVVTVSDYLITVTNAQGFTLNMSYVLL